jgi:hypothetical protein
MRKVAFLAPALLCACATAPAGPIIHGDTPGHVCKELESQSFIGQLRSGRTGGAIKRATRAAVLRWAPPGVMLTMDFRSDRVTVWLGPDNRITKIHCG